MTTSSCNVDKEYTNICPILHVVQHPRKKNYLVKNWLEVNFNKSPFRNDGYSDISCLTISYFYTTV